MKLKNLEGITFERSDFIQSSSQINIDLVVSLRCFEYFDDKPAALKKIIGLLAQKGRFVLVTKNSKLFTSKNVQDRPVHSDQQSKRQMILLLKQAGFEVEHVYPATMRWKTKYTLMRWFFGLLHKIVVASNGRLVIPILDSRATESYVYVASKPAI